MDLDSQDLISEVNESVKDLQNRIDKHCCLVTAILEGQGDTRHLPVCPARKRELKLREAIEEAIEVLEQSRKSFKSKQLEGLRKKLTQVLIDNE